MRTLTLLAALVFAAPAFALIVQDEKDLEGAKCPVSGKAVNPEASTEYKGGTLYFCCENCPKAFEKDTTKFEPKANAQLSATGQTEQKACPISGRPTNPEVTLTVAGAEVEFCCENCQGKVEAAEGDQKITLIFANTAFEKAFEVKKGEEDK